MELLAATLLQQKLEYYLALHSSLVLPEFLDVKLMLSEIIPNLRQKKVIIKDENDPNVTERRQALKNLEDKVDNIVIFIQRSPMLLSFFQRVRLKKRLTKVNRLGQKIRNMAPTNDACETEAEEQSLRSLMGSKNYGIRPSMYTARTTIHDDVADRIEDLLLDYKDDPFKVIGVIGSRGIGKSTIIKKVYEYEKVRKYFDCYAWISNPSSSFEPENILRDILRQFHFGSAPYTLETMNKDDLLSAIHEYLTKGTLVKKDERKMQDSQSRSIEQGAHSTEDQDGENLTKKKKFLLVLDGVSDLKIWESVIFPAFPFGRQVAPVGPIVFEGRFEVGRILFTSSSLHRSIFDTVVNQVYVQIHLEALSSLQGIWPMFCELVFPHTQPPGICPQELEDIGKRITGKSGGITFVIRLLAGVLRGQSNSELWNKYLERLDELDRQLPYRDATYKAILLSYYALASPLKSCFLYFSIFPVNYEIPLKRVIRLWVAEGLVEEETPERTATEEETPKRTATEEETPKRTATEVSMAYLQELINRELIHPARLDVKGDVETCKIDDQVRTVALDIIRCSLHVQRTDNDFQSSSATSGTERTMLAGLPFLSINLGKDSIKGVTENNNAPLVRSCIISGKVELELEPPLLAFHLLRELGSCLSAFQLLRVLNLDLEGSGMETLPDSLGSLVHLRYLRLKGSRLKEVPSSALRNLILLRYLGLRRTGIRELPAASLLHLTDLHTLDVRDTKLRTLPGCVTQLPRLRHIYLCSSFRREFVEMPLTGKEKSTKQRVIALQQLQTLAGVRATSNLIEELGRWETQLRKLSIGRVAEADSKKLCAFIKKMNFLRSLSITSDINESMHMGYLAAKNLDTLRIGGSVQALEHVIDGFSSLCRLFLWDNLLKDDPLPMLQKLPNLMVLSLTNTFQGKKISCDTDGFPKLKTLSIFQMRNLESWQINGGMQKLECLSIGHCPKLIEPLLDIEKLPSLLLVKVAEMREFAEKIEKKGKDSKHVFKVRHVPLFKSGSSTTKEKPEEKARRGFKGCW